jgi:hypothetical protein
MVTACARRTWVAVGWVGAVTATALNGVLVGYGAIWLQFFGDAADAEDYSVSADSSCGAAAVVFGLRGAGDPGPAPTPAPSGPPEPGQAGVAQLVAGRVREAGAAPRTAQYLVQSLREQQADMAQKIGRSRPGWPPREARGRRSRRR